MTHGSMETPRFRRKRSVKLLRRPATALLKHDHTDKQKGHGCLKHKKAEILILKYIKKVFLYKNTYFHNRNMLFSKASIHKGRAIL
jgi:hypothetical protein